MINICTVKNTNDSFKLLIPMPSSRVEIIQNCHSLGHFKTDTIYKQLSQSYYWPKMRQQIQNHVDACHACLQYDKSPKVNHQAFALECSRFNSRVGMDCVFGLNQSRNGYVGMVVFTDYYTKWPEVFAIKSKEAKEIAEKIYQLCSKSWCSIRDTLRSRSRILQSNHGSRHKHLVHRSTNNFSLSPKYERSHGKI